jgi:hypothetical protein
MGRQSKRPEVELRERLLAAKRAGIPFERAWPEAVAAALAGLTGKYRTTWRDALHWSEDSWRRAYEGDRDPAGEALLGLRDVEHF